MISFVSKKVQFQQNYHLHMYMYHTSTQSFEKSGLKMLMT